jgi:photosystem II stability/assembly factor-like uncharacterized protein
MKLRKFAPLGAVLFLLAAIDAQAQWSVAFQDRSKQDLNVVFFVDSRMGWVVGDKGIVHVTQDGGREWLPHNARVDGNISDIFFRNREEGWLISGAKIYRTQNGGSIWDPVFQFETSGKKNAPEFYSIVFANKNLGWVVGTHGRILHSNDGGLSWESQESGTNEELVHLKFVNDRQGWVVGDKGIILYTDDGGKNWERQNSSVRSHLYHIETRGKDTAIVVGENGVILRTSNGGDDWERVAVDTKETLVNVGFVGNQGWIVGWNGTILRSGDGGKNWVEQESGTHANLYGLSVSKKEVWVSGAEGFVLKYSVN